MNYRNIKRKQCRFFSENEKTAKARGPISSRIAKILKSRQESFKIEGVSQEIKEARQVES
jgi:hypothetical protein